MKYVGAHVSTSSGVSEAPARAQAIGAKAFALFTRNPSRWRSPAIKAAEAEAFRERCKAAGYAPSVILPHDSFLINLGAPDPEKLAKSREAFLDELHRCGQLGLTMLNFHPGSHLGEMPAEACLDLIAQSINEALSATSGVKAVIENTAGQGSNLGYDFTQLQRIIAGINDKERVGVCIDTCHTFAAGYDLASEPGYENCWEEFDRTVGLRYLSGMHINDSKRELGSHIDRHESLGKGHLGRDFFVRMMNDPRLDDIPMILETPDESLWAEEIQWLYSLIKS